MPLRGEGFGLLSVDKVEPELLKRFGCGKPHLTNFSRKVSPGIKIDWV